MRSYSLSRIDILHIILILITQLTLCLFAAFAIHPLAGLLTCIFTFGLVPLVNDIVAKDRNDPPYSRCDGCGNLRSENDIHEWHGYGLCSRCSKDSKSQKEFATKFPMWLKRYRKN